MSKAKAPKKGSDLRGPYVPGHRVSIDGDALTGVYVLLSLQVPRTR